MTGETRAYAYKYVFLKHNIKKEEQVTRCVVDMKTDSSVPGRMGEP